MIMKWMIVFMISNLSLLFAATCREQCEDLIHDVLTKEICR